MGNPVAAWFGGTDNGTDNIPNATEGMGMGRWS